MENTETLGQAVTAVTVKDYKAFEVAAQDILNQKMQTTLAGFMSHLEKNTFKQ